jgi:hypothetical protein
MKQLAESSGRAAAAVPFHWKPGRQVSCRSHSSFHIDAVQTPRRADAVPENAELPVAAARPAAGMALPVAPPDAHFGHPAHHRARRRHRRLRLLHPLHRAAFPHRRAARAGARRQHPGLGAGHRRRQSAHLSVHLAGQLQSRRHAARLPPAHPHPHRSARPPAATLFTEPGLVWRAFWRAIDPYLVPMLVGGIPLGLACGLAVYIVVRSAVAGYQHRRQARICREKKAR